VFFILPPPRQQNRHGEGGSFAGSPAKIKKENMNIPYMRASISKDKLHQKQMVIR